MPAETHPAGDLTRRQTADRLGVGLTTVDRLIADGKLESYKLDAGRRAGRRIVRESIERLRSGGAE